MANFSSTTFDVLIPSYIDCALSVVGLSLIRFNVSLCRHSTSVCHLGINCWSIVDKIKLSRKQRRIC